MSDNALALQIELFLLSAGGWVATSRICAEFGIPQRALRQDGDRPGMLDAFAVSSTREGTSGYCHHRFLPTDQWLPIKHRMRRHAISELRRVRAWDHSRKNILTGKRPDLRERHTGQLVLIP